MNLPAYPKYKDSGVAWLGMVPEGWEVKKLGHLCSKIGSGKTPSGGAETYVAEGILFLRSQNIYDEGLQLEDAVHIDEDIDSEMSNSRVLPHDILLNITGASLGRTCIVPDEFLSANVNQHVCIVRLIDFKFSEYVSLFLKSAPSKAQFAVNQNGAAREGLNFVQISKIELPFPPLPEQQAIAAFLDRETTKIDALVGKQRHMLDLLKEKRTALISHAVTKGLNPDAKLKDSGVAWLGRVPEGWEVKRLKSIATMQCGYAFKSEIFTDEGIPLVRMSNLKRGNLDLNDAVRIPFNEVLDAFLLEENDLLLGLSGSLGETGSLGNFAIVKKGDIPSLLNQRVGRFILSTNIMARFLVMVLQTELFSRPIELSSTGTAQFNVSPEAVGETTIPLPPLSEQHTIVTFLDRETAKIDTLATRIEDMITKLQEYRTALITAAVTGKVDVRGNV